MASARPVITPRRLAVRIAGILSVGVLIVVLHFTGVLGGLQQRLFPPPVDWNRDYAVVEHLRDLVIRDGLTRDPKACLLFVINGNDPPQAQRIQVWQKRSKGCPVQGSTKGALPVLFTLLVDRDHHTVQDDQGSPGRFHALPES
ncbi:hypothetical protein [Lichenicoccus sp.]|uniref:hypothetical protein n=1 Tax=Lichenicoccus sp. TaxID=2781899 RepID=UPI003D0EA5C5